MAELMCFMIKITNFWNRFLYGWRYSKNIFKISKVTILFRVGQVLGGIGTDRIMCTLHNQIGPFYSPHVFTRIVYNFSATMGNGYNPKNLFILADAHEKLLHFMSFYESYFKHSFSFEQNNLCKLRKYDDPKRTRYILYLMKIRTRKWFRHVFF